MDEKGAERSLAGMMELELRSIFKRYDGPYVVDGLSFGVQRGELCCILGPSGCGKTTTLKIVAGFLSPDSGQVRLSGMDITHLPPQRRGVGMVFQNYALFPHMNVFENVAYGLRRRRSSRGEVKRKVDRVLELVRLKGYGDRRIHELSGGQQQRIAVARSLVIEPKVLLLDEPLSNLDAGLRADMRDEIRRIQREVGMTTIYVTHDQDEAMSLADRLAVMNEGRIEQYSSPREVYERPASSFVAGFIGRVNFVPGTVANMLATVLGKIFPLSLEGHRVDGAVTCAIRPENIKISSRADPGDIMGVIAEKLYYGSTVVYQVAPECGGEEQPLLAVEVSRPIAVLESGQRVGLKISPDDLVVFPGGC